MICPSCRNWKSDESMFCPNCGIHIATFERIGQSSLNPNFSGKTKLTKKQCPRCRSESFANDTYCFCGYNFNAAKITKRDKVLVSAFIFFGGIAASIYSSFTAKPGNKFILFSGAIVFGGLMLLKYTIQYIKQKEA